MVTRTAMPVFEDDFQFDRRTEGKARDAEDEARGDGLFAEDIPKQLRRRIGDLRMLRELGRRGDVHAEPHDAAHAVERTQLFLRSASTLSAAVYAASRPAFTSRSLPTMPTAVAVWPEVASIPLRKRRLPV